MTKYFNVSLLATDTLLLLEDIFFRLGWLYERESAETAIITFPPEDEDLFEFMPINDIDFFEFIFDSYL